jgi:hypothetical protein
MSQHVKMKVKLILKILSDLEPLKGSPNKKTLLIFFETFILNFHGDSGEMKA